MTAIILVLVISVATGTPISLLRSTAPMAADACPEFIDHIVKEGKLLAAVQEQNQEPIRLDIQCVPEDRAS